MKTLLLSDLTEALRASGFSPQSEPAGADVVITDVCFDSRAVTQGALFVALRGAQVDGHRYLASAAASGAVAVLVEEDAKEPVWPEGVSAPAVVRVRGTRGALAQVAAAFYGHPGRALRVVGLTGTNGKTTTTWLLEAIAQAAGIKAAVVGTIGVRFEGRLRKGRNTTPESLELQRTMAQMVEAGVEVVFMEVSSHALVTHRVDALPMRVGAFLNLSQDHLNFHGTMEAYFDAKARLFEVVLPESARALGEPVKAVVHVGDPRGEALWPRVPASVEREAFDGRVEGGASLGSGALRVSSCELDASGAKLVLEGGGGAPLSFKTRMLGALNVENVVAAVAVARAVGIDDEAIVRALSGVSGVPGRLEAVQGGGDGSPLVVVDYAHTPEAVRRARASLRPLSRTGRVLTVLGCGGDRDKGKRPLMAQAAVEEGGLLLATSDNPRSEPPEAILADMLHGLDAQRWSEGWRGWVEAINAVPETGIVSPLRSAWRGVASVVSRREAIAAAVGMSGEGDVVLVAGKGHEETQEEAGVESPLSDVEEVAASLRAQSGRRVVETVDLPTLSQACGARWEGESQSLWRGQAHAGVLTDSRRDVEGAVFVALRGDRFDGHDYLAQVVSGGASALVVEGSSGLSAALSAWSSVGRAGVTLVVEDTLHALGSMASAVLSRLRALKPWFKVVGITGSNGKTTTKELSSAVLTGLCGLSPSQVHRNPGNHNNLIGVPQTIFELRWGHEVAVLEMGTNAFGEIARLVEVASPDVRVLTTIGGAHLEGFGTLAGVTRAKSEMFEDMREGQVAVVPARFLGSVWGRIPRHAKVEVFGASRWGQGAWADEGDAEFRTGRLRRWVSVEEVSSGQGSLSSDEVEVMLRWEEIDKDPGEVTLDMARPTISGEGQMRLVSGLRGAHNAQNLGAAWLAASCVARQARLERVTPGEGSVDLRGWMEMPSGRLTVRRGAGRFSEVWVLDDSYNANPGSMDAGLEVLCEEARRRGARAVAVLGDMYELGARERELHMEVGRRAVELGVDALVAFGSLGREIATGARGAAGVNDVWIQQTEGGGAEAVKDAVGVIAQAVGQGPAVVLVKGSRGVRLERVALAMAGDGTEVP